MVIRTAPTVTQIRIKYLEFTVLLLHTLMQWTVWVLFGYSKKECMAVPVHSMFSWDSNQGSYQFYHWFYHWLNYLHNLVLLWSVETVKKNGAHTRLERVWMKYVSCITLSNWQIKLTKPFESKPFSVTPRSLVPWLGLDQICLAKFEQNG